MGISMSNSFAQRFSLLSISAWLLTAGIFTADAFTPLSIAIAVLYGIVILMVSSTWSRNAVINMTAICMVLTLAAYGIGHGFNSFGSAFGRCLVSLSALAIISLLVLRGQATNHALRQLNSTLEERIAARTDELKRTNEQLQQSQKLEAIGQLTGGVAHDFNNILQVIISNLQMVQMELAKNHPAQRRLDAAAYAADRGAKLSSQLLAFARRHPLQPKATNLGRVLRDMDELLRRALGESIEIETIISGGLWITSADPHQLENAILNIAINARDAMKGEGKLTLEVGNAMLDDHYVAAETDVPAGQYVMLAISDTGSGMSPETMTRVFEPFFTTKREGEGTGLGLSMVFGFVKQSHGHIRIYSEVGNGTAVKIYLPRCDQIEEEVGDAPTRPVMGGTETILVVEDDLVVQATAVDMLTELGYRVLKANDGESALIVLQSGVPIDLLFTDVVMPGPVRSPELARQAKQLLPNIEVLFTSGYTRNAIVHGGRLDPGVDLISKPYRREDLARKIRHLLANAEPIVIPEDALLKHVQTDTDTSPLAPLHILVVEDNGNTQNILCEVLAKLGHSAKGVNSAEKALHELEISEFDILLTDINLPGMSGVELARKVFAETPLMSIVISSGYGNFSKNELEFETEFLPKPFNIESLKKVLAQVQTERQKLADEKIGGHSPTE
jgi:signal transduction histidine kinase/two-component SAPR family response regulator